MEKNTQKYYDAIKQYRDGLKALNDKFDPMYRRCETMRGSAAYKPTKDELDKNYNSFLAELRVEAQKELTSVMEDMENTYKSRPMAAPTDEQLRCLSLLRMRESLSTDELRAAANTMQGCPAAMEVVAELAHKQGATLALERELSSDSVRQGINALRKNGEHFISKVSRLDDRGQYINGPASGVDYGLFMQCGELGDIPNTLRAFGNITDADAFSAAVDGE